MSLLEKVDVFRTDDAPNPLRVVHVVRQFAPGIGGLEEFVHQLGSRQAVDGHSVRVVTLDRIFGSNARDVLPSCQSIDGMEVVRIPFRGSQRYPIAPRVLSQVLDADVIHVHGVDFFADYLAMTRMIHRKPMVLTTHGGFFHTGYARWLKQVYFSTVTKASLSQFGAVTACSVEDARLFRRVVDDRLKLIRNAVDIDKFAALSDESSRTMIYFGRLADNKRIDRLIVWFAGLVTAQPGWTLIIAGKPMGVTADELEQEARHKGVADSVEIHLQPSLAALRELIGRSSAYVCASSYEGFGLAAVEAASAGLFPILSDIPPFADTIEQLGFGCTVEFSDEAAWPASYVQVEAELEKFRAKADPPTIRRALEPYAWSNAVPKFEALYRDLLGEAKRRVGPVTIDVTSGDEAKDRIIAGAAARAPLLVAFCNAHSVNVAVRDASLRDALGEALVLNDGVGVDWASKALFGRPFPENLNGTDFITSLLDAARHPLRVFLVGAQPGVAQRAADALQARHGNVSIAGVAHGFFDEREGDALAARISESGADLVLVALGQPRQEIWAHRHYRQFGGPTLCVGALFDFLAGRVRRAPPLLRRLRLEWLFRLSQEPKRLAKRYLVGNLTFLGRLAVQVVVGGRA